jgi:hypothetical protein
LCLYFTKPIQGVDEIRRLIERDSENKTIYNAKTTNIPFNETIEPFIFF